MVSSSVITKQKQNRSIFYSCPGAVGPIGANGIQGPKGDDGIAGPKGDMGTFTGDLKMTKGSDIAITVTPVINYPLTGGHSFYLIPSNTNMAAEITGIDTGSLGRSLTIVNASLFVQTFIMEDVRSLAANRFVLGEGNKLVNINGTITFIYVTGLIIGGVASQSRWVMTSST